MSNASVRPRVLPTQVEHLPAVLRSRPQWVTWRHTWRHGKWTKIPWSPHTGREAKSNDPATWGSFERALQCHHQRQMDGVGFVFSPDDPYCGVDLDKCRDPATGLIHPWAAEIIRGLDTYTEVSPSGTGVKLIARAILPPGGRRQGQVEMYDRGRYFALTGHALPTLPDTPKARQARIAALHARLFAKAASTNRYSPQSSVSTGSATDDDILARALAARNGTRFARLWSGDISGYVSHSEADLALCTLLAFWTGGDPERIDALFRRSGLYRPKWERHDYRDRTVSLALAHGGATAPMGRRLWRGIRTIPATEVRSCLR
jgi:putative DNA primase/helicase